MLESGIPRIIGHRGVRKLAPENSLSGVREAARQGARWVELDVTLLGDGTPVIHHDDDLARLCGRPQPLRSLSLADLPRIDIGSHYRDSPPEPLPTLTEMLALLDELEMGLNLEVKDHGEDPRYVIQQIVPIIERFDPERLILSSFSSEQLRQCQLLLPDLRRGLITARLPPDWPLLLENLGIYSVHYRWQALRDKELALLTATGRPVICWTVNNRIAGERLLRKGVTAIITDDPRPFSRFL
ncbi:glycerophosphoryl diester phosphodiesterase [Marinobacterium sp. D7]|uniref:glycerophosphodiester phosphodiesterase n=1 Tax=Marinobacterium ramblicola TaxID=2849041 RepID=UPI001C2D7D51|nr:glycerophosphodiester phosphodiesterase family protein [Marinobacterium ramblicola]MBV1789774.1 glycerophosphoryl diester phosphodiesterase [Marinobacterium ramblicola]